MRTQSTPPTRTNKNPVLNAIVGKWQALTLAVLCSAAAAHAVDLVWIGGSSDWNIAGNWSPAQVPAAVDNAWITNSGTYTVTVPANAPATAGTVTVGGASGTQILAIDKATLTIAGASVINANGQLNFLVAGSTVTGAGNLTVNGTFNWPNGTMSGTGATTIGSSGVLAIGNAGVTLGRTLNNGGTTTWGGGNLTLSAGVALNNLAGGTFDITADGHVMGGASTTIGNSGLFRQTAGTTGTIITSPFNNGGTVGVLAATLSLNLGGTHSGVFINALGTTLQFGGGSHVLTSSSFVTGPGGVALSGNATTLSASGTFDTTGSILNVTTGVATLTSGCVLTGTTLNIGGTGGVVLYNSAGAVAAVNMTAGTLGTLGGINPVTVTGPLTLGGGNVTNALVTANGGLTISGNVTINGAKLVNPGLAIWSAGNFTGANGAVFSNLLGATFLNTFDGSAASGTGTTPIFVNQGTFAKTNGTAAAGTTSIDFQFINTGTVEVRTNTLRYGINQQTAGLTLLDGGGLSAQAQPLQFLGGSLVGTGLVTVANVQHLVNSASVSPGFPLGEMDITGNYQQTASGVLNIELGGYSGGTNFDLVTVTGGGGAGVATLGGTLSVALTNGFSPTNGATFTFLTAASRVGAFSTFNYPSNDIGMQLITDATSATIKITNLKPVVANPITDPASVTYGAAFNFQFPANTFTDPDGDPLTYTATGMPPGVTFDGATRTFSGSPTQAGVFSVTVSASDGGTPNLTATNTFNLTVNPATLTIAAQPQTKSYGVTDPALSFTTSGLQFSDTAASVLTGALTRVPGETVTGGPYAISQGTLAANGNYTISFTGSTLAISPATLTVTAQPKTKTYGTADPGLTFVVGGLQFSDTAASVLTGGLARVTGESVVGSPYAIVQGTLAANGNYTINFTASALTVSKAPLSVSADPKTKIYGATDPAFTVSYATFVNGDTAVSLGGTLAFARASGENVGGYLITPSGLTSANYTITFNTGTLTVSKAPLSVTADPKTKTYGATDPAFTVTYATFVNGDTVASLGGTLAFVRAPGENVGSYLITPSGLTSGNYNITFNTGSLTITKAALTITANSATKLFGTADPAFTASFAGLVNNDTVASLDGTLAFARAAGEGIGSYAITPTGVSSGNYTISFNAGTLTITAPAPTILPPVVTKTNVVITWSAVSNATYRVQFKADLTAPWTDLPGDVLAAGSTASKTDAPTSNSGFYRIQVLP